MCIIKICNLKLSYKRNKNDIIVNIPNIEINKGDIVGFFGPNHVGKSTLLKYIAQIHTDFNISNDSILYNNKKYDKKNCIPLVLYIPQDYSSSIFPWLSIGDNLRILLKSLKYSEEDIENQILKFSKDFGYEDEEALLLDYGFYKNGKGAKPTLRTIAELSGGQKQILTVLRTILVTPEIITMDEPFSALDIFKGTKFRTRVFKYLRKKSITTLIVSHELEEIIELTDRLFIFNYDANGLILKEEENCNIPLEEVEYFANKLKYKYNLRYI